MSGARPKCYGVTADRRSCVLAWPHYGEDHKSAAVHQDASPSGESQAAS